MFRYILYRVAQVAGLIIGVLMLVFFMVRLTGDPSALMLSREASPAQIEAFRQANGFDRPILEQFGSYMGGVVRGDLGQSLNYNMPTMRLISGRMPATLELAVAALLIALVVAVPLGVLGGIYPHTVAGAAARLVGLLGQSVPSFVWAILFILLFALNIQGLPSSGRSGLNSLILPALALSLGGMGQLTRLTRAMVLEVREENYVRAARARGLSGRAVAFRHILPNVAIPLISVVGIQFTYLLGGSVYIETIFAWPGLGLLLQEAIFNNDFPLIQAITIFIALFAISINLVTDLLYAWIDPRVR